MLKRCFDLVLSVVGLLLLLPLLLLIAILIKVEDRGSVFYRQVRVGKDGKPFRIWKFRTMRPDADRVGLRITVAGDTRVTSAGRFLRRHKLDELPQLLNVLAGEMSFVGPRPEVQHYVALYTPEQRQVLKLRPGITDPASLLYRNEEGLLAASADPEKFYREECMPAKILINLAYARRAGFARDLLVILHTIGAILGVGRTSGDEQKPQSQSVTPLSYLMLAAAGIVLVVALSAAFLRNQSGQRRADAFLGKVLPAQAEGWNIKDQPLAATEGMADVVRRKLDYDDYVFRRYERLDVVFEVYVAYWAPGKIPTSMVAAHTPDVCWVSSGWKPEKTKSNVKLAQLRGDSQSVEWRIFTSPSGQRRYVWFWLIGGTVTNDTFGRNLYGVKYVAARLRDLWQDLHARESEQFFIRISSEQPLENLWQDELFNTMMHNLDNLALHDTASR